MKCDTSYCAKEMSNVFSSSAQTAGSAVDAFGTDGLDYWGLHPPSFTRPAAIVRNRRVVGDGHNLQSSHA